MWSIARPRFLVSTFSQMLVLGLVSLSSQCAQNESITWLSGSVVDADTGDGIPDVSVYLGGANIQFRDRRMQAAPGADPGTVAFSDSGGSFRIPCPTPGQHTVIAVIAEGTVLSSARATASCVAGSTAEAVRLRLARSATLSGMVADDEGNPLEGVMVQAVRAEYYAGKQRYYIHATGRSNAQGEYNFMIPLQQGENSVLLMATWAPRSYRAFAMADAPLDPERRRKAYARTFYPNVSSIAASTPLLLKSGEKREGINLQLWRNPSLCVEGKVNGLAKQQRAHITLEHTDPGFGATRKGGSSFSFTWFDIVEADKHFRICGLTDGTYYIRARDFEEGQGIPVTMFGQTVVTLLGRDAKDADLFLAPMLTINLRAEMSEPKEKNNIPAAQLRLILLPLDRNGIHGEKNTVTVAIPDHADWKHLLPGQYTMSADLLAPTQPQDGTDKGAVPEGLYVKDIRYGAQSVMDGPFALDLAHGAQMVVTVGTDGGRLKVSAVDEEGKPHRHVPVWIYPSDAKDVAQMASRLLVGETDQFGNFQSALSLAPGKYRVAVFRQAVPEIEEKLNAQWNLREGTPEVNVRANETAAIRIVTAN